MRFNSSGENGVLSGRQDIANYLKKGVRRVQRYEHELGCLFVALLASKPAR